MVREDCEGVYQRKDKLGGGSDFVEKVWFRPPDRREGWSLSGIITQGISYFLGVKMMVCVCSGSSGASGPVDF